MEPQLGSIEQSFNFCYSDWVREVLDELPDSFTITDPSISGHPIVFASGGFLKISGYSREEVIGRNGRMFQGPKTDRRTVMEIREAIREERSIEISILNYRKDGSPIWILFHMSPVYSKEDGRLIHFLGVQVPILRKTRLSKSVNLPGDELGFRETGFGFCRMEVCSDSMVELGLLSMDSALVSDEKELEIDEFCEASEMEKQRAATAINNVLSILSHCSKLTSRHVCEKKMKKRCCIGGMGFLGASLIISLARIKQSFVLTDPHLPDMPIVYASDSFLELTGYARHEVLGQNCRFLSGKETVSSTQIQIRESIQTERSCTVRILNYRKDGTPFWNFLHISPVRNARGKIAYFVGVQIDESSENENEGGGLINPRTRQLSVVGAVKVAVRSLSITTTTSHHP